jgi:hypothetical protein
MRGVALASFVCSVLLGRVAAAEEDPMVRSAARDLAVQGAEAYDAGDYATALDRFARAAQLYPAPTLVVMQARSLLGLGRWVESFEKYHQTARMVLPPDAAEPLQQAVRDAARERDELDVRLPRIEIRLESVAPEVVVLVDGQVLPPALINVQHPIDPGPHVVEASVKGAPHFRQDVELAERQQLQIVIPPIVLPEPATAPVRPVAPPVAGEPPPRPQRATPTWVAPVAFGAGGAGAGIAVVGGILAAERRARLEDVCNPGCPLAAKPDLESFRLYRGLFFIGTAVGLAGLGIGTYFAVWGPDGTQQGVALDLGPDGARLSGRF